MFSTPQPYNKKCYCAGCSQNELVYSSVAGKTAQRHNKRARLDAIRCESGTQSTEEACGQTNSPAWEGTPVSDDENVPVTNEEIHNSKYNGDENKENDNEDEDVVKVEVEEFVNEDPFAPPPPDMPENPVHRIITTFVVMLALRYVVNKGAVILITFINKL
ncbi:hypothetical protein PHYBLDRAFT_140506 [Phycomyces blakesleeanus NRRL 1555(-)]|uniref:Uncharacterized protein n=1 Tax=Phycomyces blakesleeanus (strain ATCC 8743b / DSM 1359 / FGSC 10004 / NBRC 33097 / NRRL 1555) TaxID=763407 RepID=A0A163EG00_PHYB8|nr:hypothetical protein PHYBLDRAFT_140506 [Phycomyces blakesleeanus NRRL 1555(-)]OAD78420.1 hypothetical protein PHYBLDRAFT_140506 [Phycomyces blakesleeanus NRRL 1555(-)]|eukprot:XP_018296460.1 hypothetical protein PHYBLDRAFT_140506 [Phycomyces blakesleeanus NRRL 1555(-)]